MSGAFAEFERAFIRERQLKDGGAVWDFTIYQIIFDPSNTILYVKVTKEDQAWTKIPLKDYFDNLEKPIIQQTSSNMFQPKTKEEVQETKNDLISTNQI